MRGRLLAIAVGVLALAAPGSAAASSWTVDSNIAGPSNPTVGWSSVACVPGGSLCAAGGWDGSTGLAAIATTTDPTGGGNWSVSEAASSGSPPAFVDRGTLAGMSCPSTSLCVAVSSSGYVIYSTSPTGGQSSWSEVTGDTINGLTSISCPSVSLCVATVGNGTGDVLTSTDPASGVWTESSVSASLTSVVSVSCPSTGLCVGAVSNGSLVTSTDPASGSWTSGPGDPYSSYFTALTCASASLCVAVDGAHGYVFRSTDPAAGAGSWSTDGVSVGESSRALACTADNFCAASTYLNGVGFVATNTAGGVGPWGLNALNNGGIAPTSITCPSTTLCVGVENGNAIIGSISAIPPTASFTYSPANPAPGQSVSFDATSSSDPDGTIASYGWDLGDGYFAYRSQVSHTYASPGTYTVKLTVTDNDGQSSTISQQVTVGNPPTVTAVVPNAGPTTGGNTVVVDGTRFVSGGTAVSFGTTPAKSVTFVSATQLKAVVPAHVAGTVVVSVTTAEGTSAGTSGSLYAFGKPVVSALSPNAGPTGGGNTVAITGSGFVPGATVKFGTTSASSVTFVSPTQLEAVAPAHAAASVHVTVTTHGGTSAASNASLYAYGAPAVTGLSPKSGPAAGGNTVTITGTRFVPGSKVSFGSAAASTVMFVSGTELKAIAPAHATGSVHVTVSTPAGTSAPATGNTYTYT